MYPSGNPTQYGKFHSHAEQSFCHALSCAMLGEFVSKIFGGADLCRLV
jgi:hypothetical protein